LLKYFSLDRKYILRLTEYRYAKIMGFEIAPTVSKLQNICNRSATNESGDEWFFFLHLQNSEILKFKVEVKVVCLYDKTEKLPSEKLHFFLFNTITQNKTVHNLPFRYLKFFNYDWIPELS
jgi:hypothetical protein